MSKSSQSAEPAVYQPMPLVVADGDEGVQLNHGRRFAFLGAGFRLNHFSEIIKSLQKVINDNFPQEQQDKKLKIAASEENAWFKEKLELNDWDEANASAQQHLAALADQLKMDYVGILPFADPKELKLEVKGHMVRPHNMHLANQVCFTIAGGEEVYNLGQYLICADWLVDFTNNGKKNMAEAKEFLQTQLDFYQSLAGDNKLKVLVEEQGPFESKLVEKNRQILDKVIL
jgi:hypothetical protein